MKKLPALFILAVISLSGLVACVDNDFEDDAANSNFYTATKRTAAQFLDAAPERYSQFQATLKRANYYSLLTTYGTFTVFAPTNDAFNLYLSENGYGSVDEIPLEICDTIVRTHIISKGAFFTTDQEGDNNVLPELNMNDRFIEITSDSDVTNNNRMILRVNGDARLIQKDDSVTNGVVHTIDRVITASSVTLPDLIAEDTTTTLFSKALVLTGMCDSLRKYIDETYRCGDDSVYDGIPKRYGGQDRTAKYPEKRYFKYTAFVETDDVFRKRNINTIDDLIAYAKSVYDASFPGDAGLYDDDFTNRKNPLNRFVSYHLMDRIGSYGDWAPYGDILTQCCRPDIADAEDFWQTMCPGAMIRFCRANDELYANRKGHKRTVIDGCKGVRVLKALESTKYSKKRDAINGTYHYLEDILVYDVNVRDKALNCRMRIDATTLCADFMNQNARGHYGVETFTGMKNGYMTGWKTTKETFVAVHNDDPWWSSYLGNAVCVKGQYDVQFKLPTPPPGLYEIRLGYVAGEERGVVQVYLNNEPCGIPVDLRVGSWDPIIGSIADTGDEETDLANDKALRNRGYMKGMDSYGKPGATHFRKDAAEHLRRILTTVQIREGEDYWLRFRQVMEGDAEWSFDYIELCPKSVYANPDGEDRH
ncbi:MAG: fasciclin domain-containing protein [Prevotella sp.]|nr:fasciclin domain-containing protein [Prevotella sp.]